jgi:hypothetical protein
MEKMKDKKKVGYFQDKPIMTTSTATATTDAALAVVLPMPPCIS